MVTTRRSTHWTVWILIGLPALPYLLMTRGLWSFPGCPPESLDYPEHPAPRMPVSGSLFLIVGTWVCFVVCSAASLAVHRWLYARPVRWLRVVSFVVPAAVSVGATIGCVIFIALATLC